MYTTNIDYQDTQETTLKGHLYYDKSINEPRPGILVAPDWTGCNEFAREKAQALAELGYVTFALDMYGNGALGSDNEEKTQLIQPLLEDRNLLKDRMLAALNTLQACEQVNKQQIGAIGFCFGGLCILDLARSGADVKGVVSFHGLLNKPELPQHTIKSKVLVLHGYADPMVPPDQVLEFAKEMTEQNVDWQVHAYGQALHAFTNPMANDHEFGTVYDACTTQRAWQAMQNFFNEIF